MWEQKSEPNKIFTIMKNIITKDNSLNDNNTLILYMDGMSHHNQQHRLLMVNSTLVNIADFIIKGINGLRDKRGNRYFLQTIVLNIIF